MAEIGAQLREARTRARIEIAQMEAQTKIRAKYLRALENEEWELLPGPTYVKSFLKTYGDMLGIDGRQLVADYKNTHEPFQAEGDIGQISKHTGGRMNRRQQQASAGLGRLIAAVIVILAIAAGGGYYLVGRDAGDGGSATQPTPATDATEGSPVSDDPEPKATAKPSAKNVSVVVEATSDGVTVCVRAGKRIEVPATVLRTGQKTDAVRGRSVVVTADARAIKLTIGGKRATLPSGTGPVTAVITDGGVKKASAAATACRA
jgi:cytoskeletal protein RodZ